MPTVNRFPIVVCGGILTCSDVAVEISDHNMR